MNIQRWMSNMLNTYKSGCYLCKSHNSRRGNQYAFLFLNYTIEIKQFGFCSDDCLRKFVNMTRGEKHTLASEKERETVLKLDTNRKFGRKTKVER
jgi:hypothetical protein